MGYKSGKIIGKPGGFDSCKIGKNNYCAKQGSFVLGNVNCGDKDKKLLECAATSKPICDPKLTAMIQCVGSGDSSGES